MFSRALNEFLLAWTFLTRLPAPWPMAYSDEAFNRSARFFPWVGLLIGVLLAVVFELAHGLFADELLALVIMLAASLLLTGAFHEDGFADYCDSFGGLDTASRLAIMKDSRLGTFGVSGLVMLLLSKLALLAALPLVWMVPALLAAHCLSRLLSISIIVTEPYVRFEGKSKPLADSLDGKGLMFSALAVLPLLLFFPVLWLVGIVALLLALRTLFVRQLRQRLGGFTGDALGAAQQLAEVLVFAGLLTAIKHFPS